MGKLTGLNARNPLRTLEEPKIKR